MSQLRRVVVFMIIASCVVIFTGPIRQWWWMTFVADGSFHSSFEWFDYFECLAWSFEFAWSLAAGALVAWVMRSNSPIWWAVALGGVVGMTHFLRVHVHINPENRWTEYAWIYGVYLVPLLGAFVGAWLASQLFFRGLPTAAAGGHMETPARWIVIVFAGIGAAFVAVEVTERLRHPSLLWSSGVIAYSHVGDKSFAAELSEKDLATSTQWMPDAPLPLRAEDAIRRAREALPALGPAVQGWTFSELSLHQDSSHFFYVVTFRPPKGSYSDWVQLPVYFNGTVTVPDAVK